MIFKKSLRYVFGPSVVITSLIVLSGCVTGMLLPIVGDRSDYLTHIARVVTNGQEVILFYRMSVYAKMGGDEVESNVPKWSRFDLQRLGFRPLVWNGRVGMSVETRLNIEDGQPPVLDSSYKEVPVLTIPAENRTINEKYVQDLAAAAEPYELSIHIPTVPTGPIQAYLILVDNRKRENGPPEYNDRIRPPMRDYQASWAIPARAGLAPAAIGADVLLSPAYLACVALGCKH
jgi:hypothetical protein